jgi:hypothetical protein
MGSVFPRADQIYLELQLLHSLRRKSLKTYNALYLSQTRDKK